MVAYDPCIIDQRIDFDMSFDTASDIQTSRIYYSGAKTARLPCSRSAVHSNDAGVVAKRTEGQSGLLSPAQAVDLEAQ